jgi:hypothetical protein
MYIFCIPLKKLRSFNNAKNLINSGDESIDANGAAAALDAVAGDDVVDDDDAIPFRTTLASPPNDDKDNERFWSEFVKLILNVPLSYHTTQTILPILLLPWHRV